MKRLHRILIVAACVLLVASMASPAFATMQILYRGTQDGYNCVGAGTIDGNVASASFSATLSGEIVPTIGPDLCSSTVTLITFETGEGGPRYIRAREE